MVGDNLDTDILFGKNVGIATCFVYSGVTKYPPSVDVASQLNKLKPDYT